MVAGTVRLVGSTGRCGVVVERGGGGAIASSSSFVVVVVVHQCHDGISSSSTQESKELRCLIYRWFSKR